MQGSGPGEDMVLPYPAPRRRLLQQKRIAAADKLKTSMNVTYAALKNLNRTPTRTLFLVGIVAIVSCILFAATLFLKGVKSVSGPEDSGLAPT
jgi:hypothetical protein